MISDQLDKVWGIWQEVKSSPGVHWVRDVILPLVKVCLQHEALIAEMEACASHSKPPSLQSLCNSRQNFYSHIFIGREVDW